MFPLNAPLYHRTMFKRFLFEDKNDCILKKNMVARPNCSLCPAGRNVSVLFKHA